MVLEEHKLVLEEHKLDLADQWNQQAVASADPEG